MPPDENHPDTPEFGALPESGDGLTKDLVYTVLSNARRRYVLQTLLEEESGIEVSALVDAVTVREYEPDYSYAQRKRVYVSLRQTHLPALHEAGVVVHDHDSGTVRRGPNFETVTLPLRLLRESWVSLLPLAALDVNPRVPIPAGFRLLSRVPVLGKRALAPIYPSTTAFQRETVANVFAAVLEVIWLVL